jgi:DNA polymerase III epsilon subunit-like protein
VAEPNPSGRRSSVHLVWWNERLCGFDLETTTVNPNEARIVQASVFVVGAGVAPEKLQVVVDPGVPIPDEAAVIHGFTTERVQAEGQPLDSALPGILAALVTYTSQRIPVVAFNARYDLTVLDRECRRLMLQPLQDAVPDLRVVDPHVIDKHLDRYRQGSRRLQAVCDRYGARLDRAHAADHDALAACRCAWVLGAKGRVVRRVRNAQEARELHELEAEWARVRGDLDLLHEAQVGWAATQALGLAQHFIRQGDHAAAEAVVAAWPVQPYVETASL